MAEFKIIDQYGENIAHNIPEYGKCNLKDRSVKELKRCPMRAFDSQGLKCCPMQCDMYTED